MPQLMESEEKALKEAVEYSMHEENFEPKDTAILGSSIRMFHNIKIKFNRCLSINQGQTLYDLTSVFKRVVMFYSEILENLYPRTDKAFRLADNEEVKISLIINTAEHCRHTLGEMEDTIKNKIEVEYVDQIDLYDEQ
jgi:hypothetical protein